MDDSSLTSLPVKFSLLSPVELRILRLKAVIGTATPKTAFLDCLNQVSEGPQWTNKTLTPILDDLRAQRFLTELLACEPEYLHVLKVDALASDQAQALLKAVKTIWPPDVPYSFSYDVKAIDVSTARWMRIAVYLNDDAEYARLQSIREQHRVSQSIMDQHFAAQDFGLEWFKHRLLSFKILILQAKESLLVAKGILAPDYHSLIGHAREEMSTQGVFWPLVASHALHTLRLDVLRSMLAQTPADLPAHTSLIFKAALALLSGQPKEAATGFSEALTLFRKIARRRKAQLPGVLLLHGCAMIASDDIRVQAELEPVLDYIKGTLGYAALKTLVEVMRSHQVSARMSLMTGMMFLTSHANPAPLSAALLLVAISLSDPVMARQVAPKFVPVFSRIEDSYPLAAYVLAQALEGLVEEPSPYQTYLKSYEAQVGFVFTKMIAVKAPWERALETIEAMMTKPVETVEEAPRKIKRMVWMLDADTGAIQPLEQSLQARGWSGGRNLSLKRLHQGDSKLDYLDDHDRAVIRSITRGSSGWYNDVDYELPLEKSIPALIGHPRVFDASHPIMPVELIEGHPEIVLSEEKTGFRLALSHDAGLQTVYIDRESSTRWRVVVMDDKALAAAEILGEDGVFVPHEAKDRLIALSRSALPGLPLRIESEQLDDGTITDGDPTPIVRLVPLGEGLKISLMVRPFGVDGPHFMPGLGSKVVTSHRVGGSVRARRDLEGERRLAHALSQACPCLEEEGPDWILDDLLSCLEFLSELQAVSPQPTLEWPEGQKFSLHGEVSAKRFKASVKSSANWFSLGGTIELDEGLVMDLGDLLDRLDNAQGRFVALDDGAFIALDRHFRAQLDRLKRLGDVDKLAPIAGHAVRELLDDAGSLKADMRWTQFVERLDEAQDWQPRLPTSFTAELREYQHDGFVWMSRLARWGAGALLADDMGLGKTVQAIAVMVTKALEGPCLVVAPTSVCGNWVAELARFAPGLRIHRLAEQDDRAHTLDAIGAGDVLITSYGLLAREEEKLCEINWSMAILDEAQAIKNADTQRAKASQRLSATFRLALTGTPVENDLDELWSIFRFVNPGLLGSRQSFAKRFAVPIERDGNTQAKSTLKTLLRPFMLRRTKTAVLTELPARTEQTLLIETGTEERAFYEALRRRALEKLEESPSERTRIHILAEITKLRLACCHPTLATPDVQVPNAKLDALLELISELREGHHRALIFSQFVSHLGKVRAVLDTQNISYQYLDGSTPAREREKRVAAFQAGEGDLFLISLKAGGFGLNLTAADYVIHLDPWWNPAVEDQASDRAHRIGQLRPVTIYRLIVKDSIEEGILALHGRKRDLADALLEGADSSGKFSEEDLLNLIRG